MAPPPLPAVVRGRAAVTAAAGLALLASLALLVVPVYRTVSVRTESGQGTAVPDSTIESRATLRQVSGRSAYLILALPVVLAGVPLGFRRQPGWRRTVHASAVLLVAFVLMSGLSVGLFYVPAALALVTAAVKARRRPGEG